MPRYTVNFLVFEGEGEMAWEGKTATAAIAETTAATHFGATLDGLAKSALTIAEARVKIADETLVPEDGDYASKVTLFGSAAAHAGG